MVECLQFPNILHLQFIWDITCIKRVLKIPYRRNGVGGMIRWYKHFLSIFAGMSVDENAAPMLIPLIAHMTSSSFASSGNHNFESICMVCHDKTKLHVHLLILPGSSRYLPVLTIFSGFFTVVVSKICLSVLMTKHLRTYSSIRNYITFISALFSTPNDHYFLIPIPILFGDQFLIPYTLVMTSCSLDIEFLVQLYNHVVIASY